MQARTANRIARASNGALPAVLLTGKPAQPLTAAQLAARKAALVAALPAAPTLPAPQAAKPAAAPALPAATVLAGRALSATWPLTSKIRWLATGNPTKPGNGRHVRVGRVMAHDGKTLADFIAAGGKLRAVVWCVARGHCAVDAPAA